MTFLSDRITTLEHKPTWTYKCIVIYEKNNDNGRLRDRCWNSKNNASIIHCAVLLWVKEAKWTVSNRVLTGRPVALLVCLVTYSAIMGTWSHFLVVWLFVVNLLLYAGKVMCSCILFSLAFHTHIYTYTYTHTSRRLYVISRNSCIILIMIYYLVLSLSPLSSSLTSSLLVY